MYFRGAAAVVALVLTAATPLLAADDAPPAEAQDQAAFEAFLGGVRAEAIERGIRADIVDSAFRGLTPNRRVVKRDRNQAEFTLTLDIYRNRVVTPANVAAGRRKADRHGVLLQAVAKKYGVQPRFILAIWGIETRYGAVTADVPLIRAVATLAFDKRRSSFYRKQLFAALEMVNRGHIDLDSMYGSWAGAMGQPQFIPTSYLAFAQDFDGDGRRDIWKSEGDVFASIANYLAKHGWRDDLTWGRRVRVPDGLVAGLGAPDRPAAPGCRATTYAEKTLPQWQELGVRRANGRDLPTRDIPAALVIPKEGQGEAYLVYRNYAAIMAYNCAHLYAITVGTLADRIDE